jgi:ribosomal protein S18 acetylase RimI-like enzyme
LHKEVSGQNSLETKSAIQTEFKESEMSGLFPKEFTLKNRKKIVIRQAEPNDAEALLRFFEEIFKDDKFFLTTREEILEKLTVEKQKEKIEKYLNKPGMVLLIAEVAGAIVGTFEVNKGERKRRQHVGKVGVCVLEKYRGTGCGTALLKSIIKWAKEDKIIEKLSLEVFANNINAISLYKKLGFCEYGRAPKEIKINEDEYVDSILMYKFVK